MTDDEQKKFDDLAKDLFDERGISNKLRNDLSLVSQQLQDSTMIRGIQRDELKDAYLEIDRHHKDFERVRIVLDSYPPGIYDGGSVGAIVRDIRNIVG